MKIVPETVIFYNKCKSRYSYDGNYLIPKIKLFEKKNNKLKFYKKNQKEDKNFLKSLKYSRSPNLYNSLLVLKGKMKMVSEKIKDKDDKRNIIKKISSTLFPSIYIKLFVIKQNFKKKELVDNTYPNWFLKSWYEINEIEPTIFPPKNKLYDSTFYINKNFDKYFDEFMSYFQPNIDFLIFCPWLKVGGADKLVINLVKGLKKVFPNKTIGLISSEHASSEIMSSIPDNISFLILETVFRFK